MSDSSKMSVTHERWQEAQAWERRVWEAHHAGRGTRGLFKRLARASLPPPLRDRLLPHGDDWNSWWAERFDGYSFLPPHIENAIELGCGPYTNIRFVLDRITPRHVICSDPLVGTYVTFKGEWLAEAWKACRVLIDDHPIEDLPYAAGRFDLVVMINVLDHVRDAGKSLEAVTRLVAPGGWLVLGQDLTHPEEPGWHVEDVGHPIRLRLEDCERYLQPFEPVHHRRLEREEGRGPELHYGTLLFAGTKKSEGGLHRSTQH